MMKTFATKIILLVLSLWLASVAQVAANPDPLKIIDQYAGDTSIYTLRAAEVPVNVLFVIDNSYAAGNIASGEKFDPDTQYPGTYVDNAVYMADNQGDFTTAVLATYTDFSCSTVLDDGTKVEPYVENTLKNFGTYSASGSLAAPIIKHGVCETAPKGETYAMGRYLNYLTASPPEPPIVSYGGLYYKALKTHVSSTRNAPGTTGGATYWEVTTPADTTGIPAWRPWRFYNVQGLPQIELEYNAIRLVIGGYRKKGVRFGAMTFNNNNKGGSIVYPISDLSDDTAFDAFLASLPQDPDTDLLSSNTARPQVGTMLDALAYYRGDATLPVASEANPYDSPIEIRCQPNFIILITNGMTNETMGTSDLVPLENMRIFDANGNEIGAPCGDVDEDDYEDGGGTTCDASYGVAGYHYLDDLAYYMRKTDLVDDAVLADDQNILTGTVLAFQTSEPLVESAGVEGGLGSAQANNANELADRLLGMLENIVRRAQSSFVAPVVPASPENRVRSGKRIYLGFFKPMSQEMWHGNLKKYILSSSGDILSLDADGNEVAYDSADSFSLWRSSNDPDVGTVEKGGVGERLKARVAADSRNIYTFLGSSADLTAAGNQFTVANKDNLASAMNFDPSSPALPRAINFVRGFNTLSDGRTVPRDWVLGDILHSKPLIFNYKEYDFNLNNEVTGPPGDDWTAACVADPDANVTDCNKTMIYVGGNDGLLHAFSDYNGEELWSFAPTDLLPYLKELSEPSHSYFVDGSASIYSYDHNLNGDYSDPGDYVILVFGTRRGGGLHQLDPSNRRGTYYALDVTVPNQPKFLFALSADRLVRNTGSGIQVVTTDSLLPKEMGETWSQPFIRPLFIDGTYTVVAFFGAGYDNNEDMRWGSTQSFPLDVGNVSTSEQLVIDGATDEYNLGTSNDPLNDYYSDLGCGNTATTGAVCGQVNPRGRGLYAIELTREGTTANERIFTHTGEKIWGYANGELHTAASNQVVDNNMTFSFPGDIKVMDANKDGTVDRIYAADTGGRVWRFLIGDANNDGTNSVSEWTGKMIFDANPGSDSTNGRKFFYAPDYNIVDSNLVDVFVSSGDRAHPLNYVDHGLTDGAVMDRIYMIKDYLDDQSAAAPTVLSEDQLLDFTVNELDDPTTTDTRRALLEAQLSNDPWDTSVPGKYGWYIKLNALPGEKALSPPLELVGYLMQTTYAPNTNITDPCEAGNQGVARFYALHALTGTAALDLNGDGTIDASDRDTDVGGGIPPEVTPIVTDEGIKVIMVVESTGDGTANDGTSGVSDVGVDMVVQGLTDITTVIPVYWMQW